MPEAKSIQDLVTEIRVLVTRPSLKSIPEARQAFSEYLKTKHRISDLNSEEGQTFLSNLRKNQATKEILSYMGY